MEIGTQRIQMYTASLSKYTGYKMYTRGVVIYGGEICACGEG